jgi:hypothetical protein
MSRATTKYDGLLEKRVDLDGGGEREQGYKDIKTQFLKGEVA